MAKYATYFRVSTENQGKSGLGLQAQQEAVQRFMKADDAMVAEFTEVESGKRHQNRPQLAATLDSSQGWEHQRLMKVLRQVVSDFTVVIRSHQGDYLLAP
jgi:hypothetical protein